MDTSLLNVLRDSVEDEVTLGGNTININLLGALDELGDNNGVLGGNVGGSLKLVLEVLLAADDGHGSTGQDVRGTNKDRVANLLSELLSSLNGGELLPGGLIDTNAIEDLRELLSVLSTVDIAGISAENAGLASLLETEGNVLGELTTDRDDNTRGALELIDIHDTLVAKLLEVELIGGIEIGRVGLGVVVDHDGLLAHGPEGLSGADSAPIELDRGTDTVDAAAENDGTLILECDVVGRGVVGGVEVVGVSGELSGQSINLLDPGPDAELLSSSADKVLSAVNSHGDLLVGETELLGLEDVLLLEGLEAAKLLHLLLAVNNVLELVEEPLVDLGKLMDLVNRVVLVDHGLANSQPAAVGRVLELKVEILELVALEPDKAGVNLADSLLERLLKGTTDGHNLTNRLHGRANVALDVLELGQIPSGNLGDDVVKRRFEVGGGGLGDSVGELRKGVAETDLGGSVGQRVAGSLGGEGRRAGKTSVDLNDTVVKAIGLKGVLDVAFTNDAQVTDDLDGSGTEHVVLLVAEGLGRSNDDRVTSVDTEGVEVLHVADSNAVVVGITDDLVLDLLPALEGLLDQDLGGECERASSHVAELLLVVGETGTETTKGVGSTDNDGVANLVGSIEGLIDGVHGDGLGDGDVDLLKGLGEEISVLRKLQCPDTGTENLDTVLLEEAELLHLDTQIEGGLTTEGQEDTIGLLPLDDVLDVLGGDGEVVDLVGEGVVGLDGSDVGVDQHGSNTGLLEGLERLRTWMGRVWSVPRAVYLFVCLFNRVASEHTRVIKLAGLANGKTTGADNKHLLDINMVAGLDNAALDVSLRIGGGLGGSSRGGREPPLLGGQPLGGVGLCLEDGGVLGAGGESPQLGRLDGDPPTMAEESRSSASLVHGRQHYVRYGGGEVFVERGEKKERLRKAS